jgi:hypothetical protein
LSVVEHGVQRSAPETAGRLLELEGLPLYVAGAKSEGIEHQARSQHGTTRSGAHGHAQAPEIANGMHVGSRGRDELHWCQLYYGDPSYFVEPWGAGSQLTVCGEVGDVCECESEIGFATLDCFQVGEDAAARREFDAQGGILVEEGRDQRFTKRVKSAPHWSRGKAEVHGGRPDGVLFVSARDPTATEDDENGRSQFEPGHQWHHKESDHPSDRTTICPKV